MNFLVLLVKCFYFMLPAYLANMAPVFAHKAWVLKFLDRPVDGGREWRGKPVFGEHKTWRGLAAGAIIGIGVAWLQYFLYSVPFFKNISLLDYSGTNLWLFGFLLGFGALCGDLVKSFFKRRVGVASGSPWIPFDQIDFAAGALIFVSVIFVPSWIEILIIFLLTFFLHILANRLGFFLKIKNTKW